MKKYISLGVLVIFVIAISMVAIIMRQQKSAQTENGANTTPTGQNNVNNISVTPDVSKKNEIRLIVNSPTNGEKVTTPNINVTGTTLPNSDVFVNDKETKANSAGNFNVTLSLDEGDNYISILVNDPDGNAAEQELTVTYEPAQ